MHFVEVIQSAPKRVAQRGEALGQQAKDRVAAARARVRAVRDDGRVRLWRFEKATLEEARNLLGRAPKAAVIDPVKARLERFVDRRLHVVLSVPEGFAAANAKEAVTLVRGTRDRVALLSMVRHETEGKHRKTVIDALNIALA